MKNCFSKLTALVGTNQEKLDHLNDLNLSASELFFMYQNLNPTVNYTDPSGINTYSVKQRIASHPALSSAVARLIQDQEKDHSLKVLFAQKSVANYPILTCPLFLWLLLKNCFLYPSRGLTGRAWFTIFSAALCSALTYYCWNFSPLIPLAFLLGLNGFWSISRGLSTEWSQKGLYYLRESVLLVLIFPFIFIGNICTFMSDQDHFENDPTHRHWQDRF